MAKDKKKLSWEETLAAIEKDYGKGSVITGSQVPQEVEVIDTGSIGLNAALGCGGWPMGKIIDMYGWESTGKSTMTQIAIGNYQKMKRGKVLLLDGENSIAANYATALGVNLDELIIVQMDASAGEGAYEKMERLIETGEVGMVVVDSYNSLQPKKVMDGEVSDHNLGLHARMVGLVVVKANQMAIEYGTTFFFIGQLRQKIGVMFGSPDTPQGGNALRFYAHVRAEVTRSTTKDNSVVDETGDKAGNKTTVKVVKNKVAPPFKQATFNILYGIGIDKIGEIIDIAKELELLRLHGGVITYLGDKYPEDTFRSMLSDNPEFFNEVRDKIMNMITPQKSEANEAPSTAATTTV